MSADNTLLLPVVSDDTPDDERVPDRFREVQWTYLPGGVTTVEFVGMCAFSCSRPAMRAIPAHCRACLSERNAEAMTVDAETNFAIRVYGFGA